MPLSPACPRSRAPACPRSRAPTCQILLLLKIFSRAYILRPLQRIKMTLCCGHSHCSHSTLSPHPSSGIQYWVSHRFTTLPNSQPLYLQPIFAMWPTHPWTVAGLAQPHAQPPPLYPFHTHTHSLHTHNIHHTLSITHSSSHSLHHTLLITHSSSHTLHNTLFFTHSHHTLFITHSSSHARITHHASHTLKHIIYNTLFITYSS